MSDRFPSEVDVVILGTGLPETMLAGACSRAGLSVLHLDRNDYFGGSWANFTFECLRDWARKKKDFVSHDSGSPETHADKLKEGEELILIGNNQTIKNVHEEWRSPSEAIFKKSEDGNDDQTVRSHVDMNQRKFSVDLVPKVLLSCGSMVTTLVNSKVCKYAEFKCVDRFLKTDIQEDGAVSFSRVPCTKSEIFQTNSLSLIDKRRLMDFLSYCGDWKERADEMSDWKEFSDKPFSDFLESRSIKNKLQHIITDTIGILHPLATTSEGMNAVCRFIDSVGRFGPSPFLFPLYGSGELSQGFLRLSAVWGGIIAKNRSINALIIKDSQVTAVVVDNQRVECSYVIASGEYVPAQYIVDGDEWIDRNISITNKSIFEEEIEHVSIANLSQIDPSSSSRLIESGFETHIAPKGYYVVHLTGQSLGGMSSVPLQKVTDKLFAETIDPLWTLSFSVRSRLSAKTNLTNLVISPDPDHLPDYSSVIHKVQNIFTKLWPDLDFLPKSMSTETHSDSDD